MVKLSDEMATGEHTPEPWRYSASWHPPVGNGPHDTDANGNILWGYSLSGSNEHGGHILPTLGHTHNFDSGANARRIIACVNACRGIETGVLEETELGPELASARGRATIAESNESKATERADDAEALLVQAGNLMAWLINPHKRRTNITERARDVGEKIAAFLAKTALAPVKPGDEGEG